MSGQNSGRRVENLARRAIEDAGYFVHDANILFQRNCPNIDLVVYSQHQAIYVQVKRSERPAGKDALVVDGSPWTREQMYEGAPIFNKHVEAGEFLASVVLVVDTSSRTGDYRYFVLPPSEVEALLRERGRMWAETPKRDGSPRSISFRKELPTAELARSENAWDLLARAKL